MNREHMIEVLVANEIEWLIGNPDKHNVTAVVDFFSTGGFVTWTDEKLEEAFNRLEEVK